MTSPRHLLAAGNLQAKKQLGQHFLLNPNTAARIADYAALQDDDVVVEIGAGLGALTTQLARRCARVIAIEKDRDLIQPLKVELLAQQIDNVEIIAADILKVDVTALARPAGRRIVVVGNLPYNISSQIIVQLVQARRAVQYALLMLQKELAARLPALSGSRDYGRLSVLVQYSARVTPLMALGAQQFFPAPRIDSRIIKLGFHSAPPHVAQNEALLFKVVKAAFGQRRKTLKNALRGSELHLSDELAGAVLQQAGIDPQRRAETLTVAEFVELSNVLGMTGSN